MTMHTHSLSAYASEREKLNRREKEILGVLHTGARMTDREIMELLNYREPNAVRPRISDLIKAKWVVECGEKPDHVTGIKVRIVKALQYWERSKLIAEEEARKIQPELFNNAA